MGGRRLVPYGIDAPEVPFASVVLGAAGLIAWSVAGAPTLVAGVVLIGVAVVFVVSSVLGKLHERDVLLRSVPWGGDDHVLDVGCGRGLLLIGAAKQTMSGRAVGIDLWRQRDQAGSSPDTAMANAAAQGVSDRVEICDADARALPFGGGRFDVVVSSLVIHNIRGIKGRHQALSEIARVLKPGGWVAIADIRWTREYRRVLSELGLVEVRHRWRIPLFLAPFGLVTARRRAG